MKEKFFIKKNISNFSFRNIYYIKYILLRLNFEFVIYLN